MNNVRWQQCDSVRGIEQCVEGSTSFNEDLGEIGQFEIVPTPGTCALALGGALMAARRRRH